MSDALELSVLFCIIVLILYIAVAQYIETRHLDFLHESGIAILLGALSGLIIYSISSDVITFNESSFFYFILPPIIFAAGFTLKKKNFMKNFAYISMFGLVGTIISMFLLSTMIIFFNSLAHSSDSSFLLTTNECLLLAAVLCATDTVAALTIVKERDYPTLNSILFGEGVVNDAVSILIFRAVEEMIKRHNEGGEEEIEGPDGTAI